MSAELSNLIGRLESVTSRLENIALRTGGGEAPVADEVPPTVVAFDAIIDGPLKQFLNNSKTIGGDVAKQGEIVSAAFQAQRAFLLVAAKSKQPEEDQLNKLLAPTMEKIEAIIKFREDNPRTQYPNHLSALSGSIPAMAWVKVAPAPAPYVKDMNEAGQFYTNRVLKDWKEKDKVHVDWVKTWIQVLNDLQAYVKQHHTTGLAWNPKGKTATAAPVVTAVPPPPPACPLPPPPPMGGLDLSATGQSEEDARTQLFASLNTGEDITKRLKKVTSDMQTHKNPNLRLGGTPIKAPSGPGGNSKLTGAKPVDKPPKLELDGKKWIVEYHKNRKDLVVQDTEMNQVIYVYRCENCTIEVKGKVNSIVIDSCKRTALVFDSVVSSVEFINSQSAEMQVRGTVPTISIDKTDGCQLYLSEESLDTVIVSAKSSEMNVHVRETEYPIPEQFRTTFNGKGLTTVVSDIA